MDKLLNHAALTIKSLETILKNRGETSGLKKWEKVLLFSAYEATETPKENRKFGLDKIVEMSEITKSYD